MIREEGWELKHKRCQVSQIYLHISFLMTSAHFARFIQVMKSMHYIYSVCIKKVFTRTFYLFYTVTAYLLKNIT